jgi:peptidyl-prolyl cis-trans isomerase B (cyclophilin B)
MTSALKKPIKSMLLLLSLGLTITACEKPASETSTAESASTSTSESSQAVTPESIAPEITEIVPVTNNVGEINMNETVIATLNTSLGEIKIELDNEKAPLSVANFIAYAADGHYDGTIFHRVIPGFMVQGGGFEPGMKQKPTREPIQNEANNGLSNEEYTIAMARTNAPHSATSQFFINVTDNSRLDFTSESGAGWGYAVFGRVVSGEDIVKKIEAVATGQVGPFGDVPKEDVVIESVRVSN